MAFRVSGVGFQDSTSVFRVPGFEFSVSSSAFRVSGFEFSVSGFGFRVSGLGFRVRGCLVKLGKRAWQSFTTPTPETRNPTPQTPAWKEGVGVPCKAWKEGVESAAVLKEFAEEECCGCLNEEAGERCEMSSRT